MSDVLAIIPTYLTSDRDAEITVAAIQSLKWSSPDVDIYVVDDCSPDQQAVDKVMDAVVGIGDIWLRPVNGGFAAAVNHGLNRAKVSGQDALLVNADTLCFEEGVVEGLQAAPYDVVGGLLLYPSGLIQHAGIYWSTFSRQFEHRFRFGPGSLPEAQQPCICPVTGALQYIRHGVLMEIGVYDDVNFRMGLEDVDYCFRVSLDGGTVGYTPDSRVIHREATFTVKRDRETYIKNTQKGIINLFKKYEGVNFGAFVPNGLS